MKRILGLALVVAAATTAWIMSQKKVVTPADAAPLAPAIKSSTEPRPDTPLKLPLAAPHILVKKGERRLLLFDGDRQLRVYRIGLGFTPTGDKVRQGDGRTPEGSFYVCVKNEASKFYRSLGLSYPDKTHAARGLRDGLIDRAQHDEIVSALDRRQRPPWNTRLGGEIFIHGNGSSNDWTWGCVALDDVDMKELFEAVPKGVAVVIEP
ncbi:MAG TPA: L,D-transpeptidase family protein [Blastocatellia bacterium]|nr:L,D-transpeptidase family protein [Blastocatellia bacterium]